MAKTAILIPVLLVALAGCTQTMGGSFCMVAQPITLTADEIAQLSDETAGMILVHNETGEKLCGWKL